jgi:hypothetical protein
MISVMKKMTPQQVREAMIEIIIGKKPSKLSMKYPEHYYRIRNEIIDVHSIGGRVRIPVV